MRAFGQYDNVSFRYMMHVRMQTLILHVRMRACENAKTLHVRMRACENAESLERDLACENAV